MWFSQQRTKTSVAEELYFFCRLFDGAVGKHRLCRP